MMKKFIRRTLAVSLCVLMLITMIPMTAFAVNTADAPLGKNENKTVITEPDKVADSSDKSEEGFNGGTSQGKEDNAEKVPAEDFKGEVAQTGASADKANGLVKSVEIKPVSIYEGTNGNLSFYYDEDAGKYCKYSYNPWSVMEYTVTWTDGTTTTGQGTKAEYKGVEYSFDLKYSQREGWQGGNTYTMTVSLGGVSTDVPVTVKESPVKNIEIEPITLIEMCHGYEYRQYNPETEKNDLLFFKYKFDDRIRYTVTWDDGSQTSGDFYDLKSGTSFNASGNGIEIADGDERLYDFEGEDVSFYFFTYQPQRYENTWKAGNTYTLNVWFMGYTCEVPITIENTPVEKIELKPVTLVEGMDGQITSDWNYDKGEYDPEYCWYDIGEFLEYTVTWKDGTKTEGEGKSIEYNDEYVDFTIKDDQSYLNPWKSGKVYTATVTLMGVSEEVYVIIQDSPMKKIEFKPLTFTEGMSGYLKSDMDYVTGEETADYWYYRVSEYLEYTITWNDDTVTEGKGDRFYYRDGYVYFDIDDGQSYENQWQSGNTYTVTVSFSKVKAEVPVTIRKTPVEKIEFEPITLYEGIHDYWDNDYDMEEDEYSPDYRKYKYYDEGMIKYLITWTDGTKTKGEQRNFDYYGEYAGFSFSDNQSYENQWTAGNTYTATATLMGVSTEIPIIIVKCGIEKIEMIKNPMKSTFERCEYINPEGAVLRISFDDGTYEDVTISGYNVSTSYKFYINKFNCEDYISVDTKDAEKNGSYTINIMDFEVTVPVVINSRDIQSLSIKDKDYVLEITAVFDDGQQKTFKALGLYRGAAEYQGDWWMEGGYLYTDGGEFFAHLWSNKITGEFYLKLRVGDQYVESNIIERCSWWELQKRIDRVLRAASSDLSVREFSGEINEKNIDDLISIAIMASALTNDQNAYLGNRTFRADSVKVAFYDIFGVMPDMTVSSGYNADDNTYILNSMTGGYDYTRPVDIEIADDKIEISAEWLFFEGGMKITFDRNLIVKEFVLDKETLALGDVNSDGTINVRDATAIQKFVASIDTITISEYEVADADKSGTVNVRDATAVQKFVAGLDVDAPIGM